jgi:siderophore synthetase component
MAAEQPTKEVPPTELSPEAAAAAAAKKAKNEAKNEEKRQAKLAKLAAKQAKVKNKSNLNAFSLSLLFTNDNTLLSFISSKNKRTRLVAVKTLKRRRRRLPRPLPLCMSTRPPKAKRKVMQVLKEYPELVILIMLHF